MKARELAASRQAVGSDAIAAIPRAFSRSVRLAGVVEAMAGVAAGAPVAG